MIKIGLTGGIGSGKSLVAQFLNKNGIVIISADEIAKQLVNTDTNIKKQLITEFGTDIYDEQGTFNRAKVAQIVFSNEQLRQKINSIVHPHVLNQQQAILDDLEQQGAMDIAGVEAALIFEAGSENQFDYIIVVHAPYDKVVARLKQRDHLSEQQIQQRIESQLPVQEKIKRADYVIQNDGTIDDLKAKVQELVDWLRNIQNSKTFD